MLSNGEKGARWSSTLKFLNSLASASLTYNKKRIKTMTRISFIDHKIYVEFGTMERHNENIM